MKYFCKYCSAACSIRNVALSCIKKCFRRSLSLLLYLSLLRTTKVSVFLLQQPNMLQGLLVVNSQINIIRNKNKSWRKPTVHREFFRGGLFREQHLVDGCEAHILRFCVLTVQFIQQLGSIPIKSLIRRDETASFVLKCVEQHSVFTAYISVTITDDN